MSGACSASFSHGIELLCDWMGIRKCPIQYILALLRSLRASDNEAQSLVVVNRWATKIDILAKSLSNLERKCLRNEVGIPSTFSLSSPPSTAVVSDTKPTCCEGSVKKRRISCDHYAPFSGLNIWNIQRQFYSVAEAAAWDKNYVPSEISTNQFVAKLYSDMIRNMIRSVQLRNSHVCGVINIAIVEFGSGHGLLSYLIARELHANNMATITFTVIATDFHDSVFRSLLSLPWIVDLCEKGVLDFAVCDAAPSKPLCSGLSLIHRGLSTVQARWDFLIIFGNYALDSLPADIVAKTDEGKMYDILGRTKPTDKQRQQRERTSTTSSSTPRSPCTARTTCDHCWLRRFDAFCSSSDQTNDFAYHCTCRAASISVEGKIPAGVHTVPIAAVSLFHKIKRSFPAKSVGISLPVAMIVGDFILHPDSINWQIVSVATIISQPEALFPKLNTGNDMVDLGDYEVPMISPQPNIPCLPVTSWMLERAFGKVFCKEADVVGDALLQRSHTSLALTSFAVATYSTESWILPLSSPPRLLGQLGSRASAPSFGPHDFCVLREGLRHLYSNAKNFESDDDSNIRRHLHGFLSLRKPRFPISLDFLRHLVVDVGCCDSVLFLDVRWLIMRLVCCSIHHERLIATDGLILDWATIALRCLRSHYSSSWFTWRKSRSLIMQWLLTLDANASSLRATGGRSFPFLSDLYVKAVGFYSYNGSSHESETLRLIHDEEDLFLYVRLLSKAVQLDARCSDEKTRHHHMQIISIFREMMSRDGIKARLLKRRANRLVNKCKRLIKIFIAGSDN